MFPTTLSVGAGNIRKGVMSSKGMGEGQQGKQSRFKSPTLYADAVLVMPDCNGFLILPPEPVDRHLRCFHFGLLFGPDHANAKSNVTQFSANPTSTPDASKHQSVPIEPTNGHPSLLVLGLVSNAGGLQCQRRNFMEVSIFFPFRRLS